MLVKVSGMNLEKVKVSVIGLGYVGLPLAVEFSRKFDVVGFDINKSRVSELTAGVDLTNELALDDLKFLSNVHLTSDIREISGCNVHIVTVPTPITEDKSPCLEPIVSATEAISDVIKPSDVIIYESTVYPGLTEEVCIPILEKRSGLTLNKDFFVGYSPERINPGDQSHRLRDIVKVTSGSNLECAEFVSSLYKTIINAGIHQADSIRIAEAAKIIENVQRDLNIGLMNELAKLFDHLQLDTNKVIKAASTKWNFLPFKPGLVGGHCIGVDPYYLTHKANMVGFLPEVILAGRRTNDGMPAYIVSQCVKLMLRRQINTVGARALILGATFKENCPDIRNSKVVDLSKELQDFGFKINIYDPHVDPEVFFKEFGFRKLEEIKNNYSVIILAVSHNIFKNINPEDLIIENGVVFDVKGFYSNEDFLYL